MMTADIEVLATRLETTGKVEPQVLEEVMGILSAHLPEAEAATGYRAGDLRTTDTVIHLTDQIIPGWSVLIRGKATEPNGHWHCTLRQSDTRDSEEYIGFGRAANLSMAMTAALLRTVGYLIGTRQLA